MIGLHYHQQMQAELGLTSGAQTHTVFGRNEPAMIHYHQQMQAALGRPVPEAMRQAAE